MCGVFGTDRAATAPRMDRGTEGGLSMSVEVRRAVTINRPRAEVFAFWRQLENLPQFMTNLKSVTDLGDGRSHWVATGPIGREITWDAEILEDVEGERLAWRSLPGARVANRGEVRFVEAPGNRGTEIHALFSYDPPGGVAGTLIAKVFGEDPDAQAREDLRRFKQILETGEVPTTEGQPTGADAERESDEDESPGEGEFQQAQEDPQDTAADEAPGDAEGGER
jgi:uncharacterized membrane protein